MTFAPVIKEGTYRNPNDGQIYKTDPQYQEGWRGFNPNLTADWRLDRDGPVSLNAKPFFPGDTEITPAWANSVNKATKWQQLSSASQDYSQSGTDIFTFSEGSGGAYSAGSDQAPRGFNYQYQSPSNVAADPSFDIMGPDIDSPTVDRWIKESTRPRLPIPTPEQLQQRARQFRKSLLRPV